MEGVFRVVKFIQKESRKVVAKGWGKGEGKWGITAEQVGVSVLRHEKVLESSFTTMCACIADFYTSK